MMRIYIYSLSLLLLVACGGNASESKVKPASEVENSSTIKGTELYRNPVTADQPISADQAAKVDFEEYTFDFGSLKEGDKAEHVFKFKNTGKAPLVITNARGNCGCTVPQWPREPIPPNAEGEIRVLFDSKGKLGRQEKEVILTANTIPNRTKLRITANIAE